MSETWSAVKRVPQVGDTVWWKGGSYSRILREGRVIAIDSPAEGYVKVELFDGGVMSRLAHLVQVEP